MKIDECIEALTQSMEPNSQMHQDNEKTYSRLFQRQAAIAEWRISDLEEGRDTQQ